MIPLIKLKNVLGRVKPYEKKIREAKASGDRNAEREAIRECTKAWSTATLDMFKAEVEVLGYENIPEQGPVVFVANHQGYGDILMCLYALDKFQIGFVAKSDLEKLPWYGDWIKNIRSVYIKRDSPRASLDAINEGIELLEQGFSLVLFPEGTRSHGPEMGPFNKGSLRLATKPEVPIVPVTLSGSYKFFEETGKVEKNVRMKVTVHPAIETKGMSREEIKALYSRIVEIIKSGF